MKLLAVLCSLTLTNLCYAEIKEYESTDNTGLNKREQIEAVEKYLVDLSVKLKKFEAKLDENANRLKGLEETVSALKNSDLKNIRAQLDQQTKVIKPGSSGETVKTEAPAVTAAEIEKINADILSLKNDDIEILKGNFRNLDQSVREIQTLLKMGK